MIQTEFTQVAQVHELMQRFPKRWFVVGGWAIDLFLGSPSRSHDDLEIGIFRSDQDCLRSHLHGWHFVKAVHGSLENWQEGEWLNLPVHEIHAKSESCQLQELEILLQEESDVQWIFRRNKAIRADSRNIVLVSQDGIPFLSPEIVLLYKAKQPRRKDNCDFTSICDRLTTEQRHWLRSALEVCYPDHPWLLRL